MSENALWERVTAAAEERHLSENTLIAYRRIWLNAIAVSTVVDSSTPNYRQRLRDTTEPVITIGFSRFIWFLAASRGRRSPETHQSPVLCGRLCAIRARVKRPSERVKIS